MDAEPTTLTVFAAGLGIMQIPQPAETDPVIDPRIVPLPPRAFSDKEAQLTFPLESEIGLPSPGSTPYRRSLLETSGRLPAWRGALGQAADRPLVGYRHDDDYDHDDVFTPARAQEPGAAESTAVYEPQPLPDDTGSYGVYGDTSYASADQTQDSYAATAQSADQTYGYDAYSGQAQQQGYGYGYACGYHYDQGYGRRPALETENEIEPAAEPTQTEN